MKIAFFDIGDEDVSYFKKIFPKDNLAFFKFPLTSDSILLKKDFEVISVRIYSKLTAKVLSKFPKLKFITARTTGFDNVDLSYCKERGIIVSNVPAYGDNTVAEHTFAILLALIKQIPKSIDFARRESFNFKDIIGSDLYGKTLGVMGTGKIGSNVVRIARGFGMKVVCYDLFKNEKVTKDYGASYVSFDQLLETSDIISLHLPLNKGTAHLIDEVVIKKMKKGAIVVNTGRGGLINTVDLAKAIENNYLAGAALDVFECETYKGEVPESKELALAQEFLFSSDRVIATPHNAFNTHEAYGRILDTTAQNIKAFTENKPINIVSS